MRLSNIIVRPLLIFVFLYLSTLGGTWNGVLNPDTQLLTLGLMGGLAAVWLLVRWRRGWHWHQIPFERVLLLWILAFGVSVIANPETWRRSAIGLWYMAVYIGVWFALADMLANRGISREQLVDSLLLTGGFIVLLGYWQVVTLIQQGEFEMLRTRPVSLLGNPNTLAAFLVVLTPFALTRSLDNVRPKPIRAMMGVYTLLAVFLIFLTFSRGGWVGIVVALLVSGVLFLGRAGVRSVASLRDKLRPQSSRARFGLMLGVVLAVLAVLVMLALLVDSFSISGRTADLRTRLWESAIEQFLDKPITGQGFFTFGRNYALGVSMPPENLHSHAHSIPLNVAAEMGIVGLVALAASLMVAWRAMRRVYRSTDRQYWPLVAGSMAAVIGFGVQHLVDLPAMMPDIALVGLLALLLATLPKNPARMSRLAGRLLSPVAAVFWVAVLLSGLWSSGIYSQYIASLQYAVNTEDYIGAVEQLQPVIDADPQMPVYVQTQAFLWGMAAAKGDLVAAERAVGAYDSFLELEPFHAPSWANKAALHWQIGEHDAALAAIEQAIILAPDFTLFQRARALYNGEREARRAGPGSVLDEDYRYGPNWARFQFLRDTVNRQLLLQVWR